MCHLCLTGRDAPNMVRPSARVFCCASLQCRPWNTHPAARGWARSSVVEHLTFNQGVGGSKPPGLTNLSQWLMVGFPPERIDENLAVHPLCTHAAGNSRNSQETLGKLVYADFITLIKIVGLNHWFPKCPSNDEPLIFNQKDFRHRFLRDVSDTYARYTKHTSHAGDAV